MSTTTNRARPIVDVLPAELLQRIFLETLPTIPTRRFPYVDSPRTWYTIQEALVPTVLSSVSHRWRALALNFAPLWTFIYADLGCGGRKAMPLPVLDGWLEKSQGNLLTIVCFAPPQYLRVEEQSEWQLDNWQHEHAEVVRNHYEYQAQMLVQRYQTISRLFACAGRWQDVFFGVSYRIWHEEVWARAEEHWPTDAALRIHEDGVFYLPPESTFVAPHLRTLNIWPGLEATLMTPINRFLVLCANPSIESIDLHPIGGGPQIQGEPFSNWNFMAPLMSQGRWHRLSTVRMHHISPSVATSFLRSTANPNLVDVELRLRSGIGSLETEIFAHLDLAARPHAEVKHLRSLFLDGDLFLIFQVIDTITAPALQKLILHSENARSGTGNQSTAASSYKSILTGFTRRSSCPLTTVGIHPSREWGEAPENTLPLDLWLPLVNKIGLSVGFSDTDILRWIARSPSTVQSLCVDRSKLLHHLTLELEGQRWESIDSAALEHLSLPLLLPNLRALSLTLATTPTDIMVVDSDGASVELRKNLTDYINTPSLVKLKLELDPEAPSLDNELDSPLKLSPLSSSLHDFLTRSRCSLTHLQVIVPPHVVPTDLIALISSDAVAPTVTTLVLQLHNWPHAEALSTFLSTTQESSSSGTNPKRYTLPLLSHLVMVFEYQYRSPTGHLSRMLRLRFEQAGLRSARIQLAETRFYGAPDAMIILMEQEILAEETMLLELRREGPWDLRVTAVKEWFVYQDWVGGSGVEPGAWGVEM